MINAEMLEARNEQSVPPPTTLHLFRFKEAERLDLQPRVNSIEQFVNSAKGSLESLWKLQVTASKRADRLLKTSNELESQAMKLTSSATCGTAFLKISDELPNLSPKELADFSKLCFGIYEQFFGIYLTDNFLDPEQGKKLWAKIVSISNNPSARLKLIAQVQRMDGDPPPWFNFGKKSWDQFVLSHMPSTEYFHPDIKSLEGLHRNLKTKSNDTIILGGVLPGEHPDWMGDNETIPTKDIVQKELDEDVNAAKKSYAERERAREQNNHIQTYLSQKFKKSKSWLEEQRQKLLPKEKFADYVLRLHARYKIWESIDQKASDLYPDESPEDIIKEFLESRDFAANPETVALFAEKSLRESGIIDTAAHPVDDKIIKLFNQLFESIHAKDKEAPSETQFHKLKETNKKVFGSLNYDIKPILELSTPDEISYLHELLETYRGYPIEVFIWGIAETASSHFRKDESEEKEKLKSKIANSLKKPTASFLRNNFEWAHNQLKESLTAGEIHFAYSPPPQIADDVKPSSSPPITDVEEIESSIKEMQEGNLSGWRIFYTLNRGNTDPKNLVEIGGKTTEEREQNLDDFIAEKKIPCSVPSDSIIRTFEWHVTNVPKEVEQIKATINIGDEKYKLIKRGHVRLFYQMDGGKKKLIFFIHQKKAQSYVFR